MNQPDSGDPSPHYPEANSEMPRAIANCDQEAWVKDRIETAIRMALSLRVHVRAEQGMMESALEGIVNGTAVEVIRTLGMEPEFANLRRPPFPQDFRENFGRTSPPYRVA